ncbi:branched-chain amino acid ABC transporter permease [Ramlibacter sp. PS3R-8]|uniref:branched-chain amino acid ABC transporter permease n=1 Tax=Ramlibacter sp. PS3R-8 TaxID=3133437 RepID=UPI00309A74C6
MNRYLPYLFLLLALAVPHVTRGTQTEFAIELLITGIFALSLNILIGRLGLISFGHGMFLGVGAYLAAFQLRNVTDNLFLLLLAALLVGAVIALLVGALVLRLGGVGFVMITIAMCQLVYVVILSTQTWSGGINGLTSIPRPTFWKDAPAWLSLDTGATFFYVALACLVVFIWLLKRLDASAMGSVFEGIRQNPGRMLALGYPVRAFQLTGFVMAGAAAAVAGALHASLFGFVDPTVFFWTTSGEVILMVILGGATALYGPLVGAMIFLALFHYLSGLTDHWRLVLGLVFVVVVLYAPRGLVPLMAEAWTRRRNRHTTMSPVRPEVRS